MTPFILRMQTCKRCFSRHWIADGASSCRAFIFAVQIAAITIYPVLIAPLFNKFDPLPPGTLRCGPLVDCNRLVGMLAALHSHGIVVAQCLLLQQTTTGAGWRMSLRSTNAL